jgi:hypothetical protein
MDQIILTRAAIIDFPDTSQWCELKSKSTERFLLWIFSVFFSLALGEAVA